MQFIITAMDGRDDKAYARRQDARAAHVERAQRMYREGILQFACAYLDEAGQMAGSLMVVEFPTEEALHSQWLDSEPYVVAKVWQDIDIKPCQVPGFCYQQGLEQ